MLPAFKNIRKGMHFRTGQLFLISVRVILGAENEASYFDGDLCEATGGRSAEHNEAALSTMKRIGLYPNPASNYIMVNTASTNKLTKLSIMNTQGVEVGRYSYKGQEEFLWSTYHTYRKAFIIVRPLHRGKDTCLKNLSLFVRTTNPSRKMKACWDLTFI